MPRCTPALRTHTLVMPYAFLPNTASDLMFLSRFQQHLSLQFVVHMKGYVLWNGLAMELPFEL